MPGAARAELLQEGRPAVSSRHHAARWGEHISRDRLVTGPSNTEQRAKATDQTTRENQ